MYKNEDVERYIKEEDIPAQEWYKNEGIKWIEKNIPTYSLWISQNYNKINEGVYRVNLNDKCVYVGEAQIVANRLIVHAWHIATEPKAYYGILPEEIEQKKIEISMKCIESGLGLKKNRLVKEREYIDKLHPILQKNNGNDFCIARGFRRNAILKNILNM